MNILHVLDSQKVRINALHRAHQGEDHVLAQLALYRLRFLLVVLGRIRESQNVCLSFALKVEQGDGLRELPVRSSEKATLRIGLAKLSLGSLLGARSEEAWLPHARLLRSSPDERSFYVYIHWSYNI